MPVLRAQARTSAVDGSGAGGADVGCSSSIPIRASARSSVSAQSRAAVVVEDRYSQVFALEWVRPAVVADGLAELQVRWPSIPIVFCETRKLAEEWTYRYLAAARQWAETEDLAMARMGIEDEDRPDPASAPEPSTAEVRAWARSVGLEVTERGRLRPEVLEAWREANQLQAEETEDQRGFQEAPF